MSKSKSSSEYYNDVCSEVYFRGGNMNRVSYDREYNNWSDSIETEKAAQYYLNKERQEAMYRRQLQEEQDLQEYQLQQQTEAEQHYYQQLENQNNPLNDNDLPF